uniref:Uncharacterized protein n=1 Tax=Chromera velia CCMP2878 TaxID=1169474 RepID=A0A0G4GGW6_9ALVE
MSPSSEGDGTMDFREAFGELLGGGHEEGYEEEGEGEDEDMVSEVREEEKAALLGKTVRLNDLTDRLETILNQDLEESIHDLEEFASNDGSSDLSLKHPWWEPPEKVGGGEEKRSSSSSSSSSRPTSRPMRLGRLLSDCLEVVNSLREVQKAIDAKKHTVKEKEDHRADRSDKRRRRDDRRLRLRYVINEMKWNKQAQLHCGVLLGLANRLEGFLEAHAKKKGGKNGNRDESIQAGSVARGSMCLLGTCLLTCLEVSLGYGRQNCAPTCKQMETLDAQDILDLVTYCLAIPAKQIQWNSRLKVERSRPSAEPLPWLYVWERLLREAHQSVKLAAKRSRQLGANAFKEYRRMLGEPEEGKEKPSWKSYGGKWMSIFNKGSAVVRSLLSEEILQRVVLLLAHSLLVPLSDWSGREGKSSRSRDREEDPKKRFLLPDHKAVAEVLMQPLTDDKKGKALGGEVTADEKGKGKRLLVKMQSKGVISRYTKFFTTGDFCSPESRNEAGFFPDVDSALSSLVNADAHLDKMMYETGASHRRASAIRAQMKEFHLIVLALRDVLRDDDDDQEEEEEEDEEEEEEQEKEKDTDEEEFLDALDEEEAQREREREKDRAKARAKARRIERSRQLGEIDQARKEYGKWIARQLRRTPLLEICTLLLLPVAVTGFFFDDKRVVVKWWEPAMMHLWDLWLWLVSRNRINNLSRVPESADGDPRKSSESGREGGGGGRGGGDDPEAHAEWGARVCMSSIILSLFYDVPADEHSWKLTGSDRSKRYTLPPPRPRGMTVSDHKEFLQTAVHDIYIGEVLQLGHRALIGTAAAEPLGESSPGSRSSDRGGVEESERQVRIADLQSALNAVLTYKSALEDAMEMIETMREAVTTNATDSKLKVPPIWDARRKYCRRTMEELEQLSKRLRQKIEESEEDPGWTPRPPVRRPRIGLTVAAEAAALSKKEGTREERLRPDGAASARSSRGDLAVSSASSASSRRGRETGRGGGRSDTESQSRSSRRMSLGGRRGEDRESDLEGEERPRGRGGTEREGDWERIEREEGRPLVEKEHESEEDELLPAQGMRFVRTREVVPKGRKGAIEYSKRQHEIPVFKKAQKRQRVRATREDVDELEETLLYLANIRYDGPRCRSRKKTIEMIRRIPSYRVKLDAGNGFERENRTAVVSSVTGKTLDLCCRSRACRAPDSDRTIIGPAKGPVIEFLCTNGCRGLAHERCVKFVLRADPRTADLVLLNCDQVFNQTPYGVLMDDEVQAGAHKSRNRMESASAASSRERSCAGGTCKGQVIFMARLSPPVINGRPAGFWHLRNPDEDILIDHRELWALLLDEMEEQERRARQPTEAEERNEGGGDEEEEVKSILSKYPDETFDELGVSLIVGSQSVQVFENLEAQMDNKKPTQWTREHNMILSGERRKPDAARTALATRLDHKIQNATTDGGGSLLDPSVSASQAGTAAAAAAASSSVVLAPGMLYHGQLKVAKRLGVPVTHEVFRHRGAGDGEGEGSGCAQKQEQDGVCVRCLLKREIMRRRNMQGPSFWHLRNPDEDILIDHRELWALLLDEMEEQERRARQPTEAEERNEGGGDEEEEVKSILSKYPDETFDELGVSLIVGSQSVQVFENLEAQMDNKKPTQWTREHNMILSGERRKPDAARTALATRLDHKIQNATTDGGGSLLDPSVSASQAGTAAAAAAASSSVVLAPGMLYHGQLKVAKRLGVPVTHEVFRHRGAGDGEGEGELEEANMYDDREHHVIRAEMKKKREAERERAEKLSRQEQEAHAALEERFRERIARDRLEMPSVENGYLDPISWPSQFDGHSDSDSDSEDAQKSSPDSSDEDDDDEGGEFGGAAAAARKRGVDAKSIQSCDRTASSVSSLADLFEGLLDEKALQDEDWRDLEELRGCWREAREREREAEEKERMEKDMQQRKVEEVKAQRKAEKLKKKKEEEEKKKDDEEERERERTEEPKLSSSASASASASRRSPSAPPSSHPQPSPATSSTHPKIATSPPATPVPKPEEEEEEERPPPQSALSEESLPESEVEALLALPESIKNNFQREWLACRIDTPGHLTRINFRDTYRQSEQTRYIRIKSVLKSTDFTEFWQAVEELRSLHAGREADEKEPEGKQKRPRDFRLFCRETEFKDEDSMEVIIEFRNEKDASQVKDFWDKDEATAEMKPGGSAWAVAYVDMEMRTAREMRGEKPRKSPSRSPPRKVPGK